MMRSWLYLFVFMCLLLNLITSHTSSALQPLSHDDECSALLQFKASFPISKSTYPRVASWKIEGEIGDCCLWEGIECNKDTGHVITLDLSSSHLYGSINSSSSLFRLVHLQRLDLADNHFNFSQIPSEIGHLSKLTYLNLSYSFFSGQIPSELSKLSKLSSLDLSGNDHLQFEKPNLRSLAQNLTSLEELHLSHIKIGSTIPDLLANLSSLTSLLLSQCELQGQFPTGIIQLPNLQILDISYNYDLTGYLPDFYRGIPLESLRLASTNFSGELPNSIGNLGSLKELDIKSCNFSGQVPSSLGNLTQLTYLDLSANNFRDLSTSSLSWIGKLTKLTTLRLYKIKSSGGIPSSLANLTQLTYLGLGRNHLSGPIPSWLMNLPQLSILRLCANNLSGRIPFQIMKLTKLQELDLSSNQLQGPIPSSISALKNLKFLDLSSNNFSDIVELEMFLDLKSLEILQLSFNSLSLITKTTTNTSFQNLGVIGLASCNITEFPNFLSNQEKLSWLDLSSNKIQGQIPEWMLNISVETLGYMNLSHNLLTGFHKNPVVLPWTRLRTLDLQSNMLQGSLPIPPASISFYIASNNTLTGELSPMICNLSSLHALDLSFNNLNGMLPQCLGTFSESLSILNLRRNNFQGSIPQAWTKRGKLRMIDLSENQLEGELPRSLANCATLEFLNLGDNQIIDRFPAWLGSLPELQILSLRSNRFYGAIEKPENDFQFPKLRIIDLSSNNFTGMLPSEYFQQWKGMKVVDASQLTYMQEELMPGWIPIYIYYGKYFYSLTITNKGKEMVYVKILSMLTAIDFSSNRFDGEIPASVGTLKGLHMLNLSHNNLTYSIPYTLKNLTQLESLDLSHNKLSGEIPQQLTELTFISFLDFSYNHLTGTIPQGKQFDTFKNISFYGNSGLCGSPLSKKCGHTEALSAPPPAGEEGQGLWFEVELELDDWIMVLMGYASGLVIGVVLGHTFSARIHVSLAIIFRRRQQRKRSEIVGAKKLNL